MWNISSIETVTITEFNSMESSITFSTNFMSFFLHQLRQHIQYSMSI
jgi:hypothetical protein